MEHSWELIPQTWSRNPLGGSSAAVSSPESVLRPSPSSPARSSKTHPIWAELTPCAHPFAHPGSYTQSPEPPRSFLILPEATARLLPGLSLRCLPSFPRGPWEPASTPGPSRGACGSGPCRPRQLGAAVLPSLPSQRCNSQPLQLWGAAPLQRWPPEKDCGINANVSESGRFPEERTQILSLLGIPRPIIFLSHRPRPAAFPPLLRQPLCLLSHIPIIMMGANILRNSLYKQSFPGSL